MKQIVRYLIAPSYRGGWTVRRQHARRISFWFRTRAEANANAKERSQVYTVFTSDGRVQWGRD